MDSRSSKKQQELLQFIDGFIKGNGYGPSYREIMRALGYKSVSTVAVHVDGLITKGYLRKKDHSARSIEVVTLRNDTVKQQVAVLTVPGMKWLEGEIEKRIKAEDDKDQIITLITAAEILGSERTKEFREAVQTISDLR
jgi:repressor LexA